MSASLFLLLVAVFSHWLPGWSVAASLLTVLLIVSGSGGGPDSQPPHGGNDGSSPPGGPVQQCCLGVTPRAQPGSSSLLSVATFSSRLLVGT